MESNVFGSYWIGFLMRYIFIDIVLSSWEFPGTVEFFYNTFKDRIE